MENCKKVHNRPTYITKVREVLCSLGKCAEMHCIGWAADRDADAIKAFFGAGDCPFGNEPDRGMNWGLSGVFFCVRRVGFRGKG